MRVSNFDDRELAKVSSIVKTFADQDLTLADAHGLALMSARKIKMCWSTDRHLGLTGATLVR